MSSFFKKHKRTPAELALKLSNALTVLADGGDEKCQESCAKYLSEMRVIMFGGGEDDQEPDPELQAALACETHKQNVTEKLITLLPKLYFETRKDAAAVFNAVVRHVLVVDGNEQLPHVEHLNDNPNLLLVLLTASELGEDAVGNNAASLTYGTMLREVARYETLCRHLLRAPEFQKMFQYMSLPTFELASDAAASFREILTRHKNLSAAFLSEKYDVFFPAFNQMLETGNYVTRRQSLKLLSELLLDRSNAPSMLKYIGSVENMCLMMNLLRDEGNPTALRRNPNPPDRCYRAYVTVYYTHHKCPVLTTHMFLLHTSQVPCGGPNTGDCLRIHVAKHVNQPSSPSSPLFH